ncbi:hypothetical protein RFI_02070, partial [Reticulomyxa filosa]
KKKDPLDGEREFYRQHDARPQMVATSIGIAYEGEPIVAVIGRPFNPQEENRVTWGIVKVGVFGFDNTTRPFEKRDRKAQIVAVPRSDVNDIWRDYILKSDVGPYQTCAGEALFRSFGGEVTKPDNTRYNYGKQALVHNPEGFVATIFGKEAHDNTCHPSLDTQQVDLMVIGATGFTGTLATRYIIEKYGKDKNYTFGEFCVCVCMCGARGGFPILEKKKKKKGGVRELL